jgi:hypothetical protein
MLAVVVVDYMQLRALLELVALVAEEMEVVPLVLLELPILVVVLADLVMCPVRAVAADQA